MALYHISDKNLFNLRKTTYSIAGLQERYDLQEAIKKNIDILAPDCLIISEEFSDWEDCKRRVDLLAIDKKANLVVIELKRDEIGAHMELQAIRYAAMISTMSFSQACKYYEYYIEKNNLDIKDAEEEILNFVELEKTDLIDFGKDVRIVLASAGFSKEITTSAIWLRDKGIDIRCVRITPYEFNDNIFINSEQIIPVPELDEYQVKFREKRIEQISSSNNSNKDYSKFSFLNNEYTKRGLIFAVLTKWIDENKPENIESIKSLLRDVINDNHIVLANMIPDHKKNRYYLKEDEIIRLDSGEVIAISNQWGIDNINPILNFAKNYGFSIKKIDK